MAIVSNTFTRYSSVGIREELSNVIKNISPEDTPFQSNIRSESVSNTYFEFQTDDSGSPDIVRCETDSRYDDSTWYNVIVSRDASDDECTLIITDTTGTELEYENETVPNDSSYVAADGLRWNVGSDVSRTGKFFVGNMDDIMHWDDIELSDANKRLMARTNYGDAAYSFIVNVDKQMKTEYLFLLVQLYLTV